MSDEAKTVEISEPEVTKPTEKKAPTREELKEQGWSAKELDLAEKRDMISKPSEEKSDAEKKPKEEISQDTKKEETKEVLEKKPDERRKSDLPDFTFKTPEQEKVFLDAFGEGTPQRGIYLRLKSERRDRQKAQDEANKAKLESQLLKDQIEEMRSGKKVEVDENGNEVDPEDQPLTPKRLREMQQKEEQERLKQDNELRGQGQKVAEALRDQEEFAKSANPDYVDTVKLAIDLKTNLDTILEGDVKTQNKVLKLLRDLEVASANADKLSLEDYNAADISYEIGKLHPNWGKNGTHSDDGKNPTKANGSLTPEQMKRVEVNTQRRTSSASFSGGASRRTVSVEDLTVKDLLKMSREDRDKFRKEHPKKMAELLRG